MLGSWVDETHESERRLCDLFLFHLLRLGGSDVEEIRERKRNPKSPNPKEELQPQNQREKWEKERRTRQERGKHNASFSIRKQRRPYRLASPRASTKSQSPPGANDYST